MPEEGDEDAVEVEVMENFKDDEGTDLDEGMEMKERVGRELMSEESHKKRHTTRSGRQQSENAEKGRENRENSSCSRRWLGVMVCDEHDS